MIRRIIIFLVAVLTLLSIVPQYALAEFSKSDSLSVYRETPLYSPDEVCTTGPGTNEGISGDLDPAKVPEPIRSAIIKAAAKYNVPPGAVAGLYLSEQNGFPWWDKYLKTKDTAVFTGIKSTDEEWKINLFKVGTQENGPWGTDTGKFRGPFQFGPVWESTYHEDGNGDGKENVNDFYDEVYAAAHYMKDLGATVNKGIEGVKKAAIEYNGQTQIWPSDGRAIRFVYGDQVAQITSALSNASSTASTITGKTASTDKGGLDSNNAKVIWQYFIGKGLSEVQVAGLMGNLQAESGFMPDRVQGDGVITSPHFDTAWFNIKGYGLAQWTSSGRQQGLLDIAKKQQKIESDLNVQLDYIWQELNSAGYKAALDLLKKQTTVNGAVDIILNRYEQPKDRTPTTREQLAAKILEKFTGIAGSTRSDANCIQPNPGGLVDCASAVGNAKIVCAAQQNFGTKYCYTDNHNNHQGSCGHPPDQWIKDIEKYGKNSNYYATECSGFVNIAILQAFGKVVDHCSSGFADDTDNFKVIPLESIQPGDLVIEYPDRDCGTGNHVAIVESYDPITKKLVTLESTAGKNDEGKYGISGRLSYRKLGVDYRGAVRYIGQGSGQ